MMIFKGYENYKVRKLNTQVWDNVKPSWRPSFTYSEYYGRSFKYLYRIDNTPIFRDIRTHTCKDDIKNDPMFTSRVYTFKQGDTLYFHKGCNIPRIKGEGYWKRAVKINKADAVVIPKIKAVKYMPNFAVFPTGDMNLILVDLSHAKHSCNIGMTFYELFKLHEDTLYSAFFKYYENEFKDYGDAKCIYIGNLFACAESDSYLLSLVNGTYNKFIFEDDLIHSIGDESQQFTMEIIDSITDMLNSKDEESVHMGMRTLAAMDYAHYPSITRYILKCSEKNWDNYKPFNSAAKFMMETVKFTSRWMDPFKEVTPEEFHLAKEIYSDIVNQEIEYTMQNLRNSTNMVIDAHTDTAISLVTPEGDVLGDESTKAEQELIDAALQQMAVKEESAMVETDETEDEQIDEEEFLVDEEEFLDDIKSNSNDDFQEFVNVVSENLDQEDNNDWDELLNAEKEEKPAVPSGIQLKMDFI